VHDSSRPRLHFTPRRGWVNDPYGVTFHGGRYHLFFQSLPVQVAWQSDLHGGHAVSDDLVSWDERPSSSRRTRRTVGSREVSR
jgi:beta-fructofuranosidase